MTVTKVLPFSDIPNRN